MPKHTPTQFYNIAEKNGMKLRSGKTINCMKSTDLGKDSTDLATIFQKCNTAAAIANSRHGNGPSDITGPDWIYIYFNEDFGKLIDQFVGGRFSTQCTRLYAIERHINKWCKVINRCSSHDLKAMASLKIEQAITQLDLMKENGCERLCGCSDPEREADEKLIMRFYREEERGPGYLVSDQDGFINWVTTPEISSEDFERAFYAEQFMWRHDLQNLRDKLDSHRSYFNRVPHRTYQEAYFALASCKINEDCAKNILSYL